MEGMQSYGWSLVDSSGVKSSILIFKTKPAAIEYRDEMNKLHPGNGYSIIELFVKEG